MKTIETSGSRAGLAFLALSLVPAMGIVTAVLGFVALLGWVLGWPLLASFGADLMPMAPSTAVLFLLYGVAICLRARTPSSRCIFSISAGMVCLGTLVALLLFVLGSLNIHWTVEQLGLNISGTVGGVPKGHMSPVTATCFLLASVSFLASLSQSANRPWRAAVASGSAGVLLGTCFILLLAYVYGTPLLYGGMFIPPALNTVLASAVLSLALLALAGWPAGRGSRTEYTFVLIFFLMAIGIATTATLHYLNYERHHVAEVEEQLSTIAELKVDELRRWRKERLGDAVFFMKNPSFTALVRRFFEKPADEDTRLKLLDWLGRYPAHHDYDQVRLLDVQGVTRLSLPVELAPASSVIAAGASEVLRSGQVVFQDFYRQERDQRIYVAILVPILDEQDVSRPLGVLVLRIDPETYLYPVIKRWPTPSTTAEILLVRREAKEVVFLNELRFQANTALNLRASLDRVTLPAVQAALGREGITEGIDYRGAPVIAALRAVPDSPWFLITRVDTAEVSAPLHERLWLTVFMVSGLLLSASAGMGAIWRQRRVQFYQERAKAADALRETEHRYRTLFEQSPDAVLIVDPETTLPIEFNDRIPAITGYSREEFARLRITDYEAVEAQAETAAHIARISQSGSDIFETRWRTKSGGLVDLLVDACVTELVGKRVLHCVIRDITELKKLEEARRQSEERYRTLAESAEDYIFIVNGGFRLEYVNAIGAEAFGRPRSELVGKRLDELFPPAAWDLQRVQLKKVLTTGVSLYTEDRIPFAKHELWLSTRLVPIRNAAGQIQSVLGVSRDITEQKRLEEQFRQAQKMETVGQLAGGIAHDFNNLLTVINGMADLALINLKEGDPLRTDLQDIRQAGERAALLTLQLLAFSRKQVMKFEAVNLSTLVTDLQGMLKRVIREDIDVVVVPAKDVGSVMADPAQIEQVVMNLAVNARDAMPNGGRLTIETRNVELDEAYAAAHPSVRPGPHVMLAISDTGVGMDEAIRTRIFEPFFTTKDPGKGTGLGLSMVYGIVKQSGGNIWVYSEPGKGASFKIYLPRVEEVAHKVRPAPTVTSTRGTETILVVEDDTALRHLAGRILQSAGYALLTAGSGGEALSLLERHDGPVHLVLTDMVMPGLSGRDLATRLNHIRPQMKVLYTSGYPDDATLHRGLLDEATHFIGKPYSAAELTRKVREVLDT